MFSYKCTVGSLKSLSSLCCQTCFWEENLGQYILYTQIYKYINNTLYTLYMIYSSWNIMCISGATDFFLSHALTWVNKGAYLEPLCPRSGGHLPSPVACSSLAGRLYLSYCLHNSKALYPTAASAASVKEIWLLGFLWVLHSVSDLFCVSHWPSGPTWDQITHPVVPAEASYSDRKSKESHVLFLGLVWFRLHFSFCLLTPAWQSTNLFL